MLLQMTFHPQEHFYMSLYFFLDKFQLKHGNQDINNANQKFYYFYYFHLYGQVLKK